MNDVLLFCRSKVVIDKCKTIMQVVCNILIDDMIRYWKSIKIKSKISMNITIVI